MYIYSNPVTPLLVFTKDKTIYLCYINERYERLPQHKTIVFSSNMYGKVEDPSGAIGYRYSPQDGLYRCTL